VGEETLCELLQNKTEKNKLISHLGIHWTNIWLFEYMQTLHFYFHFVYTILLKTIKTHENERTMATDDYKFRLFSHVF